jgi:hypothetical protein
MSREGAPTIEGLADREILSNAVRILLKNTIEQYAKTGDESREGAFQLLKKLLTICNRKGSVDPARSLEHMSGDDIQFSIAIDGVTEEYIIREFRPDEAYRSSKGVVYRHSESEDFFFQIVALGELDSVGTKLLGDALRELKLI